VRLAFANPLPMDSLWEGKPIQYLSIVFAEFCGLLAGVCVLSYRNEGRWFKGALVLLVALVVSYVIGVVIWSLARAAGILLSNPINPFLSYSTHPLGSFVLIAPEFIGTGIGTALIHAKQKLSWRKSLLTMVVAMLTSLLVGFWIATMYLRAL